MKEDEFIQKLAEALANKGDIAPPASLKPLPSGKKLICRAPPWMQALKKLETELDEKALVYARSQSEGEMQHHIRLKICVDGVMEAMITNATVFDDFISVEIYAGWQVAGTPYKAANARTG